MARTKSYQEQLGRERMFDVLGLMRRGISLREACKQSHTDPRTARKHAGKALRKSSSGRIRVSRSDRLTRYMQALTPLGSQVVRVVGSAAASELARYWAAVHRYADAGDDSGLIPFEGKSLRNGKNFLPYLTDQRTLRELANAHQVAFEDLYARAA